MEQKHPHPDNMSSMRGKGTLTEGSNSIEPAFGGMRSLYVT